jgi:endoribonuclease Dicer
LAGAILVDSGYNKERVFQSMRPLLDPLITPETVVLQPAKELSDLCAKEHYIMKKPIKSINNGTSSFTIEVEADGIFFNHTATAANKDMAKKVASKVVLDSLKEHMSKKRTLEVSLS